MDFSDQALIFKLGKFKEADLWVRLLSPDRGVYTAFAFGGSRSIRRFCGCLDVLNIVSARVEASRTKEYMVLREASLISCPSRLRTDLGRLGIAVNCLKFMEAFDIPPDSAAVSYQLVNQLLALLEEDDSPPPLLPNLFRFCFASLQGFAPQINTCRICKADLSNFSDYYFQTLEGGIICPECLRKSRPGPYVRLCKDALTALQIVQQGRPHAWKHIDFGFNREMRAQCADAIDGFIHYHVGLAWQGNYFKRI